MIYMKANSQKKVLEKHIFSHTNKNEIKKKNSHGLITRVMNFL